MTLREEPMLLPGGLVAILHRPADGPGGDRPRRGCVIVVGGPQYRAGSHRAFVLLARRLAAAGVAVLRFDHAGIGDSVGDAPGFEAISPDIRTAVEALAGACPGLDGIALWGLCDAVPAILAVAADDARVTRLVLLNPWVRTEAGAARAELTHYYGGRLRDPGFWRRLLRGEVALGGAVAGVLGAARRSRTGATEPAALPDRMAAALARFRGATLVVTSGQDLIAREFLDLAGRCPRWRAILARPGTARRHLEAADHTFSSAVWREQVADWTLDWLGAPA
ncbi:hydrolase 1, exosortase A system-associated [Rhodocista pekingensis]|uniref:Hydrolase 1, exosortase A system-associated n=1 Tax=Rhodocista pekingensis TaxID=201185 RepID=A0ABW2KZ19_9PROT